MDKDIIRCKEIEKWFLTEYALRLGHIKRCKYFGIEPDETEYGLQLEAYEKEQEYRKLTNKKPLQALKEVIHF